MPDYTDPNPNPAPPEPQDTKTPGTIANEPVSSQDPTQEQKVSTPTEPDPQTEPEIKNDTPSADTSATEMPKQESQQAAINSPNDPSVITSEESGGGGSIKKFALPVLGLLLLVFGVGTGVILVRQNQNIEEEASTGDCTPPTAEEREWWSPEIGGNHNRLPPSASGTIAGLEPGSTEVIVEAWSDSAFGCGTNQDDESAQVTVNGQTVTVTDTAVPGSTTVQVIIGQDGVLNITATALGDPGSMFVYVRVPTPPAPTCLIPPAEGRLLLNFVDEASFLESWEEAQNLNFNTEGSSYRVLIQKTQDSTTEFFVVLIDNDNDEIFITRTNSIDNLPTDLDGYEQLSDDNINLGPDAASLEAMIGSYTGQDPNSISVICASFEEYELDSTPTATPTETQQLGATCSPVTAYDTEWNEITAEELADLQAGDTVRFQVSFETNTNGSTVDKARFNINNGDWIETTESVLDGTYYVEYQIPEGVSSFDVNAEIHLLDNDTWY